MRRFYADSPMTSLKALPGLASDLGLRELIVKDESSRFDLPAFKIVGVRFATARLRDGGQLGGHAGGQAGGTTLVAATTGNHGRAVARVARERGLSARIYVPGDADPARVAALRDEGAEVVFVEAGYDEAVRRMAADAAAHGWTVVSDASWDGYETVPRDIMTGYTRIFEEARAQWDARPDVVVVQAGVGSLAGAAAGWLAAVFGDDRPRLVIAEPEGSACVMASLAAGRRVALETCARTKMAGLRCAEVSPLAWPVIRDMADAAVAVTEAQNDAMIACLAERRGDDEAIAAGPSGGAGLAALARVMTEDALAPVRDALGLTRASRVMALVTEGRVGP